MQRYSRQIILPNFGYEAQKKLSQSKVLVVGAGGLGVPVLQYLTAAGVGRIGIADGDVVDMSNLQRQVLYNESEIGKYKAQIAKGKLELLNSEIQLDVYPFFVDKGNVFELIENYDIIVDCTDNFPIRYLLNDACFLLRKALVFASIFRFEAQLSVFHFGENPFNLRDVFSEIPEQESVPNCNEAGVIGAFVGIVGGMQALEVIKIITNIGKVNSGNILVFNGLDYSTLKMSLSRNKDVFLPDSKSDILEKNYGYFCNNYQSVETLKKLEELLRHEKSVLIDVREVHELPKIKRVKVLEIPLSKLLEKKSLLQHFENIVFICQKGIRSKKAIDLLQDNFPDKNLYNVKNGITIFENN